MKKKIRIFTDGGARKYDNSGTGLGGWGVYSPDLNYTDYGYVPDVTNNQMELEAVHRALMGLMKYEIADSDYEIIEIYTDSSYVVGIFTEWIYSWIINKTFKTKKNYELINRIYSLIRILRINEFKIEFIKVKGHSDNQGNIEADRLVNKAIDERYINPLDINNDELIKMLNSYIYKGDKIERVEDDAVILYYSNYMNSKRYSELKKLYKLFNIDLSYEAI